MVFINICTANIGATSPAKARGAYDVSLKEARHALTSRGFYVKWYRTDAFTLSQLSRKTFNAFLPILTLIGKYKTELGITGRLAALLPAAKSLELLGPHGLDRMVSSSRVVAEMCKPGRIVDLKLGVADFREIPWIFQAFVETESS